MCPAGTRIICRFEAQSGPHSRFNVQWSLYSQQAEDLGLIAVLEIKNTNIIYREGFGPAEATAQNWEAKTINAPDNPHHTTKHRYYSASGSDTRREEAILSLFL